MKQYKFYKFCLWKAYLEKGMSLTSYAKYFIALIGVSEVIQGRLSTALILMVNYAVLCFFIGWAWWRLELINTEYEVQNRVNPFVKEMLKRKV